MQVAERNKHKLLCLVGVEGEGIWTLFNHPGFGGTVLGFRVRDRKRERERRGRRKEWLCGLFLL